jgi:hypothetical protein
MRWISTCSAVTLMAASVLIARAAEKGPWRPILSEADYKKLVEAETKTLNDALAKGISDKKVAVRALNAAMMLAAYHQAMALAGNDAPAMAGARDAALAAAKAVTDGNADAAKKALGEKKTGKPDAVDLSKGYELADLMTQFKPEKSGGRELEKKLKATAQKRAALTPADLNDAHLAANMMAIIAQYTEAMAPEADAGMKKKADWIKWSVEMGELSVAAAKAAGAAKPDDKAVKAAFKKLDESCNKCHAVFRD